MSLNRQMRLELDLQPVPLKDYVRAKLEGFVLRQQARDARRKRASRVGQIRRVK